MKKTIFTYILIFLFCILFLIGFPSAFLSSQAYDVDGYMEEITSNGYSEVVLQAVYDRFEDFGDVITLDADALYDLIDEESIVEHSKTYTKTYLASILNGESFSEDSVKKYDFSYAKNGLKSLLEEYYQTSEREFTEEEFVIIYDYIETQINSAIKFLPTNILDKTASLGKYAVKAKSIFNVTRFMLILSAAAMVGIILLSFKNGIGKVLYRSGASLFISTALLFVPFFLFNNYNLGSKVVIMKSPLSVVFSSVLEYLIGGFTLFTGILFALASLLVVAGTVLTVLNVGKKHS